MSELASNLGVDPERVETLVDQLDQPAVIGVYPPDPAEAMLRRIYQERGLTYPGGPPANRLR
jgi:hypothetical protein